MTCQNIPPAQLSKVSVCFNFLYALNPFHEQLSSVPSPFSIWTAPHRSSETLQDKLVGSSLPRSVTCRGVIQLWENQTPPTHEHYSLKAFCEQCQ